MPGKSIDSHRLRNPDFRERTGFGRPIDEILCRGIYQQYKYENGYFQFTWISNQRWPL